MRLIAGKAPRIIVKKMEISQAYLEDHARQIKPLIDALAAGRHLEFLNNDGIYRLYRGTNLIEIVMSPHRYRIVTNDYI